LPFIRSIGIGGMLIPAVSVIVSITLLPAMLSFLGHRINKLRVMPKRFVSVSDTDTSWWGRWAHLVVRRPWPVAAVGTAIGYVLLFVILLTYVLLARAFRSLLLPLKAVVLNLVSLGAAYGIIVFIFQQGHGAQAIWNVPATQSIIPWIPLMIFAFLYGLSMD